MTLIASYMGRGTILIIGDLMLSRTSPGVTPIAVPTRFDPRYPLTNLNLSGLSQKLIRINPRLAVAWAGNYLIARHILTRVASELPRDRYNGSDVVAFIRASGLSAEELDEVAFIFWLRPTEEPLNIQIQDWNVKEALSSDGTEKFKFAGSGEFHFFETIGFRMSRADDLDPWWRTISAVVGRAAIALHEEIMDETVHNFFYGGGFEVFVPEMTGFEKVPISFVFWAIDRTRIELVGPIYTQMYDANGILGLRRFVRSSCGWECTLFKVGNFFHAADNAHFNPTAPLDTVWSVHYLVDANNSNSIQFMQRSGPGHLPLEYTGTELNVRLDDRFYADLQRFTGTDYRSAQ